LLHIKHKHALADASDTNGNDAKPTSKKDGVDEDNQDENDHGII
jgi:hypothetical protein